MLESDKLAPCGMAIAKREAVRAQQGANTRFDDVSQSSEGIISSDRKPSTKSLHGLVRTTQARHPTWPIGRFLHVHGSIVRSLHALSPLLECLVPCLVQGQRAPVSLVQVEEKVVAMRARETHVDRKHVRS